nr:peptidyl-prolyl cis-trans isomerase CYP20-1 [Tanacetum cinerariifolium]
MESFVHIGQLCANKANKSDKYLKEVTHKVYFDVEIVRKPAGAKSLRNFMSKEKKKQTDKAQFMHNSTWETLCKRELHAGGSVLNVMHTILKHDLSDVKSLREPIRGRTKLLLMMKQRRHGASVSVIRASVSMIRASVSMIRASVSIIRAYVCLLEMLLV